MNHIKLLCVDCGVVAEGSDLVTSSDEAVLENRFGGNLKCSSETIHLCRRYRQ